MVAAIVGEGGSGGAVALAARQPRADVRARGLFGDLAGGLRLDPRGAPPKRPPQAAEAMKMTAQDLEQLGVIDRIVPEPLGGAHRDPRAAVEALGERDRRGARCARRQERQAAARLREDRFLAIGEPRKRRGRTG